MEDLSKALFPLAEVGLRNEFNWQAHFLWRNVSVKSVCQSATADRWEEPNNTTLFLLVKVI